MKTNISVYIVSLVMLIAAIVLVIENPSSGKTLKIAGGLTCLAFAINILSFLKNYLKKQQMNSPK